MPFLRKENFAESFINISTANGMGEAKFIREGTSILYDPRVDTTTHANLARNAGLISPTDAGLLEAFMHGPTNRKLLITGQSSSLVLPKIATEREITLKVLQELSEGTGITVISVPTNFSFIPSSTD